MMARFARSGVQDRIDSGSKTWDASLVLTVVPPKREPAWLGAKASSHLDSLDGLRALSILLVIFSHSAGALGIGKPIVPLRLSSGTSACRFFLSSADC